MFLSRPAFCLQLGASVKPGFVMETVTVRTTRMRTTVMLWCVSSPITCAPATPPSVCLQRNSAMAPMTAQMALTRNSVVRNKSTQTARQSKVSTEQRASALHINSSPPSVLQICALWTTATAAITAQWLLARAWSAPVRWAWSWGRTTRPVRSRASAPSIWSAASAASRTSSAWNAPVTRAGSWSPTWKAAKARVRLSTCVLAKVKGLVSKN